MSFIHFRRSIPFLVVVLFLAAFGGYVYYLRSLAADLKNYSDALSRVYGRWFKVLKHPDFPEAAGGELAQIILQEIVDRVDFPILVTDSRGHPLQWGNVKLPAAVTQNPDAPQFRREVEEVIRRLDLQNPPDTLWLEAEPPFEFEVIHYGNPPAINRLGALPWITAAVLLVFSGIAYWIIRYSVRAEKGLIWAAMARESAHQMGTPLSSLKGWLEVMALQGRGGGEVGGSALPRSEIVREMEDDLERLSKVANRFELVGHEPSLAPVGVHEILIRLDRYFRARLPRLARQVKLRIRAPELPPVLGNPTLLEWAFENLIKNSLDALKGRDGHILVRAKAVRRRGRPEIAVLFRDTGPGIPRELRREVFRAGVTSKPGGWGVGLTLAKRIIEDYHGGELRLVTTGRRGTTFRVTLPVQTG